MAAGSFGADRVDVPVGARVFLMGCNIKANRHKTLEALWTVQDSLEELTRLCETAGLEVLGSEFQNMQTPSPSTFIGQGKLRDLAVTVDSLRVDAVIFDDELSPAQNRNLQEKLSGKGEDEQVLVIDRTMLILQIFAQRARTSEAKLQVEWARMKYMLPRLQFFLTTGAGMDARGGSGGGGGQFLKGAGELQLEADRRIFRKQIQSLEVELEEVRAKRGLYRDKRRERDTMPVVAIVGYTNAGKSTLFNRLCNSEEVYADDLLFATLDPTSRLCRLPGGKEIMISDTVGFVQKLPTKLVSSFRASLEELEDAAVILHVVDASSPLSPQQAWSVCKVIEELDRQDTPQVLVLNKIDLLREGQAAEPGLDAVTGLDADGGDDMRFVKVPPQLTDEEWMGIHENVTPQRLVEVSARTGEGIENLLQVVEDELLQLTVHLECLLPYSAGDLLAEVHKTGTVELEEYEESGTRITAFVPISLKNKIVKAGHTSGGRRKTSATRGKG